jgi:hypothetical protein
MHSAHSIGRRQERLAGVDDEQHEGAQIVGAAAGNFHDGAGSMSGHRVAGVDVAHALLRPLAQAAGQHGEGF